MVKVRTSRRVAGLKPGDYDHEIDLVNHDEAENGCITASATNSGSCSSTAPLAAPTDENEPAAISPGRDSVQGIAGNASHEHQGDRPPNVLEQDGGRLEPRASPNHPSTQPCIEIRAATPDVFADPVHRIIPKRPREIRETAIDILYENERGGFLCGVALFSAKALGGLDPPAWTNAYHKPSPTNRHTATVPDPSWEWVWPEWRINYQEGVDEGGWEYSFAFSKVFSWHEAKWWNSFVRRRAWIRKRAKRKTTPTCSPGDISNADYFTIRPASYRSTCPSKASLASSRVPSRSSMRQKSSKAVGVGEEEEEPLEIEDIDTLLHVLSSTRIDREKREAVENYLDHAVDLSSLQDAIHEIMAIFVFQASRKQLLAHLMRRYDETVGKLEQQGNQDDKHLMQRKEALEAATKHADEEVSRLAYWSDVKKMAERGELRLSLDKDPGWYDEHPGLDRSGPSEPRKGKLPGFEA